MILHSTSYLFLSVLLIYALLILFLYYLVLFILCKDLVALFFFSSLLQDGDKKNMFSVLPCWKLNLEKKSTCLKQETFVVSSMANQ